MQLKIHLATSASPCPNAWRQVSSSQLSPEEIAMENICFRDLPR